MDATDATGERGGPATAVRLRGAAFDLLTKQAGADTEAERADLFGCDRTTLWRIRNGQIADPSLALAMRIARVLGVHVEDVFEYEPGQVAR